MFLEDRIKGVNEYKDIEIKAFPKTFFEVRELTAKEQREMLALTFNGMEAKSSNIVDVDQDEKITIDIAARILNNSRSMIYLVSTVFKQGKSKTKTKDHITLEEAEYLTDDELKQFVDKYNELFDKEE